MLQGSKGITPDLKHQRVQCKIALFRWDEELVLVLRVQWLVEITANDGESLNHFPAPKDVTKTHGAMKSKKLNEVNMHSCKNSTNMYKLCKHELNSCAEPGEQLNLEMN